MIPTPPNVIIKQDSAEEITESGIIIPKEGQGKKNTATVHRVAKKVDGYKPLFKEGNKIVYDNSRGIPIKLDGEDYLVIQERDVFLYEE